MIGRSSKALFLTLYVLLMLALPEAAVRAYFAALLGPRILWYGTTHFRNAGEVAAISADDDLQHHRSGREGFLKLQAGLNEDISARADKIAKEFIGRLDEINRECRKRGIDFIPITQQANSKSWYGLSKSARLHLRGLTFEQEIESIRQKARRFEPIDPFQLALLVHATIMDEMKAWANQQSLPLVDFIQVLNQDRHLLLTWVHLHRDANAMLASSLGTEILRRRPCEP